MCSPRDTGIVGLNPADVCREDFSLVSGVFQAHKEPQALKKYTSEQNLILHIWVNL